ncbi:hypothetical protein M407DRAFT_169155 [Tulasnella calospora MUT 4182]|uniref:Uncharacterized protein n=1 Tax=Tulasnella calospora MUT 4182 TaxID=1051891 RepID=A0A0C3Q4C2_9AGAM|nr:hypothetical protein M407DRAFT_169155 [Tulasnella calospora MUT 4182]
MMIHAPNVTRLDLCFDGNPILSNSGRVPRTVAMSGSLGGTRKSCRWYCQNRGGLGMGIGMGIGRFAVSCLRWNVFRR